MTVSVISTIEEMQALSRQWQQQGNRTGFVPTMGNLHEGHLKLVEAARQQADRVVVSIFVNPLQFGPQEDFDKYPRTLDDDVAQLEALAIDAVFAPDERDFYHKGRDAMTYVEVPGLSSILCGASRPGHFRGVTTVVNKLLNIVRPDIALFGLKDYQQFTIIRQMVEDLSLPVKLVGLETVRETDGLAMSSRNRYLSAQQRETAPTLYRCLQSMRQQLLANKLEPTSLLDQARQQLEEAGFQLDYLDIRDAESLLPVSGETKQRVILTAVWLGETRLIDNILV